MIIPGFSPILKALRKMATIKSNGITAMTFPRDLCTKAFPKIPKERIPKRHSSEV